MSDSWVRNRFGAKDEEDIYEKHFPPTYMVVEFAPNIRRETAQWIVDRIRMERKHGGIELLARAQPPIEDQSFTVHVSADLPKLLDLAEEQDLRKVDKRGILREFSIEELEEFTHSVDKENLLTMSEKQAIVRHELENIRATQNETYIPGYSHVSLYEGQSILSSCVHHGIVKQFYPLHDLEEVKKLGASWYMPLYSKQPYEEIRAYFGEAIALYFQFLGFYTLALVPPMILGFIQLLMPPEKLAYFSVFNIIIATLFLELWRRKCAELAFSWGTITMTSLDEPRPNFRGHMAKDCVTDRLLPQYPRWKTNAKMYCVSLPVVVLCMFGAFLVMLASFKVEDKLKLIENCPVWLLYMPSTIYAALIYIMNLIYRRFANFLTEWENHRTQSQFDRHRVTKLVLFEFVNNFMSLFYIAFIIQDMEMLRFQLATLLIILQGINNLQEAVLPLIIRDYSMKMKQLSKSMSSKFQNSDNAKKRNSEKVVELPGLPVLEMNDPRIKQAISEGLMEQYDDPYDDYLELFVQFGYVFLFSSIYPMAAFWAVFNNILEIRSDAFKLCCVYQRSMGRKVKDTGAWQRAFQALCTMAVITNCALLCLSPGLKGLAPDASPTTWVMYFVVLEHLLLALKQVLHFAIPDKPEWVRVALARSNFLSKQALKKQRILKSHAKPKLRTLQSRDVF